MPYFLRLFHLMLKFRSLISMTLLSVLCVGAYAADDSGQNLPETQLITKQINKLQQSINLDVAQLKKAKGELEALTEYRIRVKTQELRKEIEALMAETNSNDNTGHIKPFVEHQLNFAKQIDSYLAQDITNLQKQLGNQDNSAIILQIAKREAEQNEYLESQLQAINWANKLGIDVAADKANLIQTLNQRGNKTQTLVNFVQLQLKKAINDVNTAGKDVTAAQTAKVGHLKEWLSQSNNSLEAIISMLDELNQNTAELKKTLFSVSGDITQDVLNIDVASGLVQQWVETAKEHAIEFGPTAAFKVFIFLIILVVTSLVARIVEKLARRGVNNSKLKISKLLQDFFTKLSSKVVYTIGILVALSQLGFELAPLLAGFGIAGVIIGFALQDTLSNFASGMMILIYRPFDVGDLINAAGVQGKVSHMSLVSTTILTLDNQRLIVPNNKIWGDTINNITVEHQRRVDMTFGIGYSDDIELAEKVLTDIVMSHPKVLKTPEPTIKLHTLNTSSVDFIVRPWSNPDDYWDVYWDITREVKMRFDEVGITIPFPQRDVHIYQADAE